MADALTFGLSRSLGREASFGAARDLALLLNSVGFATVQPFDSYQRLERALLEGQVDAAWAPPLVCAVVEQAGGVVALRAIRAGTSEYGAAIVANALTGYTVSALASLYGMRAAWVDEHSLAGYILPRHSLRHAGVDLDHTFVEHKLLGSYEACLQAIKDGVCDISACFCSGTGDHVDHGYKKVMGADAGHIRVLMLSAQAPHDGIALSPMVDEERKTRLRAIFRSLGGIGDTPLARAFDAEGFDEPTPGSYARLLELID